MRRIALIAATTCLVTLVAGALARAQVPIVTDTIPAEDRAAAAVVPDWEVPRTSWGHPSLEGVWSTDDMRSVPRERDEEFGTRDRLTPEEFAERAASDAEERDRILNRAAYSSNSVGSRTFGWTSQVIDPPNGRIPPMNETGIARARPSDRGTYGPGPFDAFEDFHLYDRCITRGILGSKFAVVYGNGLRIVQNPDSVVISYEMLADTRIVRLDGRPHAEESIRQYLGNSRGYWEGDTLVAETRNLTNRTSIGGNGIGVRHSEAMTVTERLTRVDPEMIEYTATVDDPLTYTEPFTVRMMFTTQPGYEIFEYSCHEANRAVSGGLGGERNYEQRVAEAVARGETPPDRLPSQPRLDDLPEDESVFININRGDGVE
ncbi:hypothetical protein [Candidatus Rariloculus sp.]|uniref:hypothetical protein n=1 Tax=Candidatus Rariloculus sp. TaxID=3101265 RepID=UPI003D138389